MLSNVVCRRLFACVQHVPWVCLCMPVPYLYPFLSNNSCLVLWHLTFCPSLTLQRLNGEWICHLDALVSSIQILMAVVIIACDSV